MWAADRRLFCMVSYTSIVYALQGTIAGMFDLRVNPSPLPTSLPLCVDVQAKCCQLCYAVATSGASAWPLHSLSFPHISSQVSVFASLIIAFDGRASEPHNK